MEDRKLERATEVAARTLEGKGRIDEVLEQRPGWIVGNGCDGLVIIRVRYAEDGLPEEREDRQGFERVASGYIAAHAGDLENCEVYFDSADFHIMGEHALMRHHVNCFC